MMVRMMKQWMLFGMGAMVAGFLHALEPAVVVVEPLCDATNAWDQAGNLNAYVGLGMGYYCGCDMLAWGQIVTYHGLVTKYPAEGWTPTPTRGVVTLCNPSGTLLNKEIRTTLPGEYNWADIRNQGAGVSRLMRDLGVLSGRLDELPKEFLSGALDEILNKLPAGTVYSSNGTAGTLGNTGVAKYFEYAGTGWQISMPDREGSTLRQADFSKVIVPAVRASLQAGAPVAVSILVGGTGGAHAIVCDGFGYAADGTELYHFHKGWGKGSDCWYPATFFSTVQETDNYYRPRYDEFVTAYFNVHPQELGCILAGRVTRGGKPVADAQVALSNDKSVTTDEKGLYCFTGLTTKTDYTVTVTVGTDSLEETFTTAEFVTPTMRSDRQNEWNNQHTLEEKDTYYVPYETGNVIVDFELPVPVEKRYVKALASGTGDGSSWENAAGLTKTFFEGVRTGLESDVNVEVYVASGNYTVTDMLTIPAGVTVKGGYNGDTRDVMGTPTTITMGTGAYGYQPGYIFNVGSGSVVDGFVLVNDKIGDSQYWSSGTVQGGTVKNCIFTGTFEKVAQDSALECCIMRNRFATQEGCSLIHCTFYGDVPSGKEGGGTVAGCLPNVTVDVPDAALKGTCECGLCPEFGLDGRALEKTPGALAPEVETGYQLRLR